MAAKRRPINCTNRIRITATCVLVEVRAMNFYPIIYRFLTKCSSESLKMSELADFLEYMDRDLWTSVVYLLNKRTININDQRDTTKLSYNQTVMVDYARYTTHQ